MAIIQGLFGDMLPPTMQDGGGMGARPQPQVPQVPRPVMTQPQQPVVQQEPTVPQIGLSSVNTSGLMSTTQTQQQPTVPDLSNIDFSNIDLSGLQNLNLGTIGSGSNIAPQPTDFGEWFNNYTEFLGGVKSGNTSSNVNRNDDIYNNFFKNNTTYFTGTPEEFRAAANLSDTFSLYDDPAAQINSQSVQTAYQTLMTAEDPLAVLSDYYGFEITPAENKGSIYNNATRYGTTADKMAEFQSVIEPILQKTIPYIQATQGLEYTDALEYAYMHDPMIASLYAKYDMDLYRQTKDGSTYIYDPIAGAEIRTLEVKDAKFKDIAPALAGIALSFTGIPAALGGAFGATGATAGAIGQGLVSTATAALGGARGSDLLVAGITGAMGGYTRGLGSELSSLNEAAQAADAAGDIATATQLASQAADVSSQLNLINTISNTARAVDAIANENYVGAALIGLDEAGFSLNDWTANKLNTLVGSSELLGINTDDLAVGVNSFGVNLLQGKDTDDALRSAIVDYAKAGGSFPDLGIELPSIGSSDFFDAVMDSGIVQTLRQLGRDLDDTIIQPVVTTLEETGSTIDDTIIQPIREGLKDIDIPTPDVNLPEVDINLPDVDLPDVNLPDINLPSLDLNLGMPSLNLGAVGGTGGTFGGGVDIGADVSMVDPAELFGYVDYIQQLMGENK